MPRKRLPTTVGETLWPFFASSVTSLRKLRLVHNKGRIGSPRVAGATRLLRSTTRVGSSTAFLLRPPPCVYRKLVRFDLTTESLNVDHNGRADILPLEPVLLDLQAQEPT